VPRSVVRRAPDPVLDYYAQSSPASRWRQCPNKRGVVQVSTTTGAMSAPTCRKADCPVCVRVRAIDYGLAIMLSRPSHLILLTDAGDDWPEIHRKLKAFRRVMQRGGRVYADLAHAEPNPGRSGSHLHIYYWGDPISRHDVRSAAVRAGFGEWSGIELVRTPAGIPLTYGMKIVLQGSPDVEELPTAARDFLALNGGRPGHATRNFYRDGAGGGRLTGVRKAATLAKRRRPRDPGPWVSMPYAPPG
jgi:hypothetical protein